MVIFTSSFQTPVTQGLSFLWDSSVFIFHSLSLFSSPPLGHFLAGNFGTRFSTDRSNVELHQSAKSCIDSTAVERGAGWSTLGVMLLRTIQRINHEQDSCGELYVLPANYRVLDKYLHFHYIILFLLGWKSFQLYVWSFRLVRRLDDGLMHIFRSLQSWNQF